MKTSSSSLQRFITWHDQWTSKSRIIILLVIYPIFPLIMLPWVGDVGGAPYLDLHLYYNADTLHQVLLQYDAVARENYRLCALTVDMVYPIYYAFLLSVLLAAVLRQKSDISSSLQLVRFLPFVMTVVDWIENLTLVTIVDQWPEMNHELANIAGYITLTKWSLLGVIIVLLIAMTIKNRRAVSQS